MLIVRGTKKLRDRMKGAPAADSDDKSTTLLGDWFVNALFWKPPVALLVNSRTFLPVYVPLAPAKTLLDRIPDAIESALRAQGVPEETIAAERAAMSEVRLAPTNDRPVVGVMNEFAYLGEVFTANSDPDLEALSMRMSDIIVGPLGKRAGTPGRELAVVLGTDPTGADERNPLAQVIALLNDEWGQEHKPVSPKRAAHDAPKAGTKKQAGTDKVFQPKVTLRHQATDLAARARRRIGHPRRGARRDPGGLRVVELPPARVPHRRSRLRGPRSRLGHEQGAR